MLKSANKRVIVSLDSEFKNKHTFSNGVEIELKRGYNNFNMREVNPVNGIVVDAENIPIGAEILIDYLSFHDTSRIFDYQPITEESSSNIHYYSISIEACYLWRKDNDSEWQPVEHYVIADRIFKPYEGLLVGIDAKQIKNVLYLKSGEYKGLVSHTLQACDYEIVFRDSKTGQEGNIIVCRHYEDGWNDREELTAINYNLTDQVNDGKLLLGIIATKAKTLNQLTNYNGNEQKNGSFSPAGFDQIRSMGQSCPNSF